MLRGLPNATIQHLAYEGLWGAESTTNLALGMLFSRLREDRPGTDRIAPDTILPSIGSRTPIQQKMSQLIKYVLILV